MWVFEKTWKILGRDFEWGVVHAAQNFARQVSHECATCQACDRPRNKFGPIVFAPIPPVTMAHVAIDVFLLPLVRADGKTFDCVVLCVDRHSGWLVALSGI